MKNVVYQKYLISLFFQNKYPSFNYSMNDTDCILLIENRSLKIIGVKNPKVLIQLMNDKILKVKNYPQTQTNS